MTKSSNRKDLLMELVRTNFKLRYNNSILGFVWVLLKPLLTFTILYVVFSNVNRGSSIENFPIYLLSGIIIYTFFSESFVYGINSLLEKAGIILKVNFPRELSIVSSSLMAVINLTINLVVLSAFTLLNPVETNILSILYFILCLVILYVLMLGLSLFSSILLVKLRDLEHIADLVVQLLFYATPVFYDISILPQSIRPIIELNPLTIIISTARSALMNGKIINWDKILILAVLSLILLLVGSRFFNSQVKRIAERF